MESNKPCQLNNFDLLRVNERNLYGVRNGHYISLPRTRTEQYRKSFLPEAIRMWNSLDTSKV